MAKTPRINITSTSVTSAPYIRQSDLNPVGMIVSSMLSETQFQSLNGTSWVLMDGRSIAGSAYATVTGLTTITDGRGLVLRGKNNGGSTLGVRADGNQNPDGDVTVGTFQNDQFQGHVHNLVGNGGTGSIYGPNSVVFNTGNSYSTQSAATDGTFGGARVGSETRMRNITVNHFIKINP